MRGTIISDAGTATPKSLKVKDGARMEERPKAMRPRARVLIARAEEEGIGSLEVVGLGMRGVLAGGVLVVEDMIQGVVEKN